MLFLKLFYSKFIVQQLQGGLSIRCSNLQYRTNCQEFNLTFIQRSECVWYSIYSIKYYFFFRIVKNEIIAHVQSVLNMCKVSNLFLILEIVFYRDEHNYKEIFCRPGNFFFFFM